MKCIYCASLVQLAELAKNPHTRSYARQRALDLEHVESGLFQGIYAEVKERVASGQVELPACVRPVLVKSR